MRSKEKLWEICMEIYRKMYKEAEPSADFDKIMESGEGKKKEFFMDYYLSEEREVEIIEEMLEKHRCNKLERNSIRKTVYLGSAPNSMKKK